MISIIILNWNGWEDTIECLKSIDESVGVEWTAVIADNGSFNDSVERITEFLRTRKFGRSLVIREGEALEDKLNNKDVLLYCLNENYGFAKGNNLGIKLLAGQNVDFYWILNNDTVIEKESMKILQSFMEEYPYYLACTPQIRYFSPSNRIWNCGGKLFFGLRKYYYEGQENVVFKKNHFDISFVTGCALFIKPELLDENGGLFTERFFFGEEDFELSLRMKEKRMRMACCTKSIIYHKVNASIKKKPKLSGIYIHYLNRYINVRQHFSATKFLIWRVLNNINLRRQILNNNYSPSAAKRFIEELNKECYIYDGVSKDMFETKRMEIE